MFSQMSVILFRWRKDKRGRLGPVLALSREKTVEYVLSKERGRVHSVQVLYRGYPNQMILRYPLTPARSGPGTGGRGGNGGHPNQVTLPHSPPPPTR